MMLRSPVAREAPAAASSAQLPANASGAVVTPLFARGLPYTVTPKLPRWFASLRAVSVVIVVLLPVAVAAVYYLTIAADQYVAEFRLSLRTADAPRIEPLLIFGGDTAHTTAATESQIVAQFIASRAIVDELDPQLDLRRLFSPPEADRWARLWLPASIERLVRYWQNQVDPFYDTSTGTIIVRVRAFTPDDALHLAQAIVAASERLINDLTARARHDALGYAEADFLLAQATRRNFTQLDALPADAALIGVFGFLNDYKGFGTVVRALRHLPKNYHLLIFGGVHPNEIPARTPIHPYLASLLDDAHVDAVFYDQMRSSASAASNVDVDTHFTRLFGRHPRDLSQRLHFMGAADDTGFLAGMAICDAVVLPYLEVGQSASGPISQAVELGCRVIASRTHTFLEFARYHPDTVEFFDIGNHLELAERIAARRQYESRRERLTYTAETNKAIYLAANSAPTETVERFHRGSAPATKIKLAR